MMTKSWRSVETTKSWNDENVGAQIEWRRTGTQDEESATKERSRGISSRRFHKHTYDNDKPLTPTQKRDRCKLTPSQRREDAAMR